MRDRDLRYRIINAMMLLALAIMVGGCPDCLRPIG